jgi:enterochelin esterase-like enzyme
MKNLLFIIALLIGITLGVAAQKSQVYETKKDNSEMHIFFRDKQVPHEYRVKDGAHTWTYWRMELPEVMAFVSKSFTQF